MSIKFQADKTQDVSQPFPADDYFLTCTDAKERKSKKSGRDMIEIELAVATGPCEGRRVWHYLTFIEAGSPGHGMTLHCLHAFGLPHDGPIEVSAEQFKGVTVKAKVEIEEASGEYRAKNVVKDWYIFDTEEEFQNAAVAASRASNPAPAEASAAPAPAPAKPAPAAPAAAPGRRLPWKK